MTALRITREVLAVLLRAHARTVERVAARVEPRRRMSVREGRS